jgi:tetratricopeptide (TPR) repeat protein
VAPALAARKGALLQIRWFTPAVVLAVGVSPAVAQDPASNRLRNDQKRIEDLVKKDKNPDATALASSLIMQESSALQADSGAVASFDAAVGVASLRSGNYEDASIWLLRAIRVQEKVTSPNDPVIVGYALNLAHAYQERGDYVKAEGFFLRAVALSRKSKGGKDLWTALSDLSRFYTERGNYAKALPLAEEALRLASSSEGAQSPEVVSPLRSIAAAAAGEKKYDEAYKHLEDALSVLEKRYGVKSPERLPILNDLIVLSFQESKQSRTYDFYLKAHDTKLKGLKSTENYGKILNNLGTMYTLSGQYDEALAMFKKSAETDPKQPDSMNNLGVIYHKLGQYQEATKAFDGINKYTTHGLTVSAAAALNGVVAASPPPAEVASITDKVQRQIQVERFVSVNAPSTIREQDEFELTAALTEKMTSPNVKVFPGVTSFLTRDGSLVLSLPKSTEVGVWPIDVMITAPQFEILSGKDRATIMLPRLGDSDTAHFRLRPKPGTDPGLGAEIMVTFWYKGGNVATAVSQVSIVDPTKSPAQETTVSISTVSPSSIPASVGGNGIRPDLTLVYKDFQGGNICSVLIASPYLDLDQKECEPSAQTAKWVRETLDDLLTNAGLNTRTLTPVDNSDGNLQSKEQLFASFNGFGKDLYNHVAPEFVQRAIRMLREKSKIGAASFKRIEVHTSNPAIPWELMIVDDTHPADGLGFLGTDVEISRWHLPSSGDPLPSPPEQVGLRELAMIAPHYEGGEYLPNQQSEINSIKTMHGYKDVPGTFLGLQALLQNPPEGIVHFAGHGMADATNGKFSIKLEGDTTLSLGQWRGLVNAKPQTRSIYFLNACDVGQAAQIGNFVYGWAPTVLETGGSGFIGGMWPLSDNGASQFAAVFYESLRANGQKGPVEIAELLRIARRKFAETGDPTFLGYVLYGNVGLSVVPQ